MCLIDIPGAATIDPVRRLWMGRDVNPISRIGIRKKVLLPHEYRMPRTGFIDMARSNSIIGLD